tara:strand:+ start:3387 stop:3917 length:531 start_codon:yes stop_codon:yes gene_type:complete
MKIFNTKLEGCLVIEPEVYGDNRGFFLETYQEEKYHEIANIKYKFVQDNFSRSRKNVLRGLHFQIEKPQGKLVRVVSGQVFDVAVDLRKKSESYGKWVGVNLSEKNKKQLWIPPGFAHGFVVLSDHADFEYKCTDYYDPDDEGSIIWNDEEIGIDWPVSDPIISSKDLMAKRFKDY